MPPAACAASRSPRAARAPSLKDHAPRSCPSSRQQVATSFQERVRRGKGCQRATLELRQLFIDPRDGGFVAPQPRAHPVLDDFHHSLSKTLPAARSQLPTALKISEMPVDRPDEIVNSLPL